MYDLNGKVALVTGAGGRHGIGRSIANRLAQEGADVVVTDIEASLTAIRAEDRQSGWAGLPSVVEEIEAMGRRSLGLYSDVSDGAQVADMVVKTLDQFGHIDILVNNAGSRPGKDRVPVLELEEEAFDEVQRVNVRGTYLVSKAVATHMVNRGGGGKIINIASGAGKRGIARYAPTAPPSSPSSGSPRPWPKRWRLTESTSTPSVPAWSTPSGWISSPEPWPRRESRARSTGPTWSGSVRSGCPWAASPKATTSHGWRPS